MAFDFPCPCDNAEAGKGEWDGDFRQQRRQLG